MAKFQNRGIVILYQGQAVPEDVEAAILQIIAPLTGSKRSKADIFQLDAADIAQASATRILNTPHATIHFDIKSPEIEAANLIGIAFEDSLKTGNPIIFTLKLIESVEYAKNNINDATTATLRALKLAAKPGFAYAVGSDTLTKYHLGSEMISAIRAVLTAKRIPYE